MVMVVRRYNTARIAQWKRIMASSKPLDTTIGQVFAWITVKGHANTGFCVIFHCQHIENGRRVKGWPLAENNRGMIYQNDGKHLNKMVG
jgi:hypothetical protein